MARCRANVLVVLIGALLLDLVWAWERINAKDLKLHGTATQWDESLNRVSADHGKSDDDDYYDYYYKIPDDATPEHEGTAVIDGDFQSPPSHEFGVEGEYFSPKSFANKPHGGFHVESENPHPRTGGIGLSSTGINVVCRDTSFQITLLTGQISDVQVLGLNHLQPVMDAPEFCGYHVNPLKNTFTVPFTGCNVKHTNNYSLQLLYIDEFGTLQAATATCEESPGSDSGLAPRSHGHLKHRSRCGAPGRTHTHTTPTPASTPPPLTDNVDSPEEQLSCVDSPDCYDPLDECTVDKQFVFAIRNTESMPLDPTKLIIPGSNCKPVTANKTVAIFRFKFTDCGAHAYEVGETKIYMIEVQTAVHALDLKYGIITRTNPFRIIIECRYGKKGSAWASLVTAGYMVKTPTSILPSTIISRGLYAVELRLAKDKTYSSYMPNNHPPLRLLLGKPVHLELNLKSAKPDAVILVNYCLAYPRSAKNALVLVFEGCANPYDPKMSVLKVSDLPQNRHQRRFVVSAFQFMDQKTNKYLDEEIYFMCSTEVCRPSEKICADTCFD